LQVEAQDNIPSGEGEKKRGVAQQLRLKKDQQSAQGEVRYLVKGPQLS